MLHLNLTQTLVRYNSYYGCFGQPLEVCGREDSVLLGAPVSLSTQSSGYGTGLEPFVRSQEEVRDGTVLVAERGDHR